MHKNNISADLVRTIEQLYEKATDAVKMNVSTDELFKIAVVVRQGCLLSLTLFNIFLETAIGEYDELLTLVKKWKLRCLATSQGLLV